MITWIPITTHPKVSGNYLVNIIGLGLGTAECKASETGCVWQSPIPLRSRPNVTSKVVTHYGPILTLPELTGAHKLFAEMIARRDICDVNEASYIWNEGRASVVKS